MVTNIYQAIHSQIDTWERVALSGKTTVSLKCFGLPSTLEICCLVSYIIKTIFDIKMAGIENALKRLNNEKLTLRVYF